LGNGLQYALRSSGREIELSSCRCAQTQLQLSGFHAREDVSSETREQESKGNCTDQEVHPENDRAVRNQRPQSSGISLLHPSEEPRLFSGCGMPGSSCTKRPG